MGSTGTKWLKEGAKIVAVVVAAVVLGTVGGRGVHEWVGKRQLIFARVAPPSGSFVLRELPYIGNASADVVLVEFADFECPACREFHATSFGSLRAEFLESGLVQYLHWPLVNEGRHARALPAAVALFCATPGSARSLLFSRMYSSDLQDLISPDEKPCNASVRDTVRRWSSEARRLGIEFTPTFLIGRKSDDGTVVFVDRWTGSRSSEAVFGSLRDAVAQRPRSAR